MHSASLSWESSSSRLKKLLILSFLCLILLAILTIASATWWKFWVNISERLVFNPKILSIVCNSRVNNFKQCLERYVYDNLPVHIETELGTPTLHQLVAAGNSSFVVLQGMLTSPSFSFFPSQANVRPFILHIFNVLFQRWFIFTLWIWWLPIYPSSL